ncbi:hypothetical protein L6164_006274 [Bauhinia variegata]|uniref:Uncharacterized protein n=1 Tax=Bauhinia variegata TaxID=167791 RepID=A0ACB9PW06_BAUVA|nr:hypothetical protein L6164_006274 [Bauhinia variegata]
MHNLVQKVGRDFVKQESPLEPSKRSRLFYDEDVLKVFTRNTVSDKIQGMFVDIPNDPISLSDNAFQNMRNLRILILRNAQFSGSPQLLPNNLRFLDWMEYSPCSRKVLLYPLSNPRPLPEPFKISTMKCYEILQHKEGIPDVSLINSGFHGSNLANEKVDGAFGIYGKEEEKESNDDLKEEEPSTSINHQIPESYETKTKSKGKGVLIHNSDAEEILDYELKPCKKIKLEEDSNIVQVQACRSTASTVLMESKRNYWDKADRIQIQVPEKRANEEFSQIKYNMEAFYASIEAESSALPLPQNSVINWPSEQTQKRVQDLQDLLSRSFSFLLQPRWSENLKNVLDYLINLMPEDGISLRMRALMLNLSKSFSQWSLDYKDASLKLESTSKTLSHFENLQVCLKSNAKEFREVEKSEIELQRMKIIFENGERIKAERDSLRNKVPRLEAEKNGAKMTQANIEHEWSNLVQQLSVAFSFGN